MADLKLAAQLSWKWPLMGGQAIGLGNGKEGFIIFDLVLPGVKEMN